MDLPKLQKIMMEFEKENAKAEMQSEMMEDAMDDAMADEDDEEEEDKIVGQVLDEIGISFNEEVMTKTCFQMCCSLTMFCVQSGSHSPYGPTSPSRRTCIS